jgi:NTE family protein
MTTGLRVGDPGPFPKVSGRYGTVRASYTFNSLDDQIVPHSGAYGQNSARWIESMPGLSSSLPVVESRWTGFIPHDERSSLFLHGAGGTTFGRQNTGLSLFYLGGPQQLSAYGRNELYGNQYFLAQAGWLRQVSSVSELFGSKIYLLGNIEAGKVYGALASPRVPLDANGGIVFRTILGPLLMGGSVGNAGHRKWYFQFGRLF